MFSFLNLQNGHFSWLLPAQSCGLTLFHRGLIFHLGECVDLGQMPQFCSEAILESKAGLGNPECRKNLSSSHCFLWNRTSKPQVSTPIPVPLRPVVTVSAKQRECPCPLWAVALGGECWLCVLLPLPRGKL